ncbi:Crp/Fnr family transcriptional regulator [Marinobacterium maritimum]|uniref:Crp/Fnr family transcriptional regulator n=1 Tax=Marinobacterium maritimum TaxID=500162 RepID=A0ABP3TAS3_9GAMM
MNDVLETLAGCRLLAGLPREGVEQAARIARVLTFAEGQTIYTKGSTAKTLAVIESGAVRINAINTSGKELTLTICGPGNWFGDAVFCADATRAYGAVAHEPTRLIEFSSQEINALLEAYPQGYACIVRELGERLRAAFTVIEDDALKGIPERLARRLLFIAAFQYGRSDQPVSLKLTQEQLGNMLGITRQAANRAMQPLVEEGLLEYRYGQVYLKNPAGLEAFIERGD